MFDYELSFYSNRVSSDLTSWDDAVHHIPAKDDKEANKFAKEFINDPNTGAKRRPITLKKVIKVF
jgi:hypothetical protein